MVFIVFFGIFADFLDSNGFFGFWRISSDFLIFYLDIFWTNLKLKVFYNQDMINLKKYYLA